MSVGLDAKTSEKLMPTRRGAATLASRSHQQPIVHIFYLFFPLRRVQRRSRRSRLKWVNNRRSHSKSLGFNAPRLIVWPTRPRATQRTDTFLNSSSIIVHLPTPQFVSQLLLLLLDLVQLCIVILLQNNGALLKKNGVKLAPSLNSAGCSTHFPGHCHLHVNWKVGQTKPRARPRRPEPTPSPRQLRGWACRGGDGWTGVMAGVVKANRGF